MPSYPLVRLPGFTIPSTDVRSSSPIETGLHLFHENFPKISTRPLQERLRLSQCLRSTEKRLVHHMTAIGALKMKPRRSNLKSFTDTDLLPVAFILNG